MIVLLFILLAVTNILMKDSKLIFFLTLIFMWILMAFTYGNADENIYFSRYTEPYLWNNQTEFLYAVIIRVFNLLHFNFYQFKACMALIQLLLISMTVRKFSKLPGFVLLMYSIFPFTMDIAQMRNALATSIMIFSIKYLMNEENQLEIENKLTKNDFIFIVCILVATFIHTASFIWIVLLFAKKVTFKTTVIATMLFFVLFSFIITPTNVVWLADIFGATTRMAAYVSNAYQLTKESHLFAAIIRVSIYMIFVTIFLYITKFNNANYIPKNQLYFMKKINVMILCIVPFMIHYTTEVYRMQAGLSIVNYIVMTNCINSKLEYKMRTSKWNLFVTLFVIMFAFTNLYLLILRNENFNTVFKPVFQNNLIFDAILPK